MKGLEDEDLWCQTTEANGCDCIYGLMVYLLTDMMSEICDGIYGKKISIY